MSETLQTLSRQEENLTMANHKTTNETPNSALLEALRSADAEEVLAYNAVDEVRDMAGRNIFAAIDTLKAEINGKLDTLDAKFTGKLDTQAAEIRMNRWMLLAFFAVATAIGLFKS